MSKQAGLTLLKSMMLCRWLVYITRFPVHVIQERNLAYSIFGEQLGESVFSEVIKAATASCMGMAASLLSYKRLPEKVT